MGAEGGVGLYDSETVASNSSAGANWPRRTPPPEPVTVRSVLIRAGMAAGMVLAIFGTVVGPLLLLSRFFDVWVALILSVGIVVSFGNCYLIADVFMKKRYMRYVRALEVLAGPDQGNWDGIYDQAQQVYRLTKKKPLVK